MKKIWLMSVVTNVLGLATMVSQVGAVDFVPMQMAVVADFSRSTALELGIQPGNTFFMQGYIYDVSTLPENCPSTLDCGVIMGEEPFTGQPEFPEKQIGRYYVSGTFFVDPFTGSPGLGEEVGLFQVILQFFDGEDLLIAKGLQRFGEQGSHPATLAVLGGTGIFGKARGEVVESMLVQNVSGAFTFTYDLSGVVNVKRERDGKGLDRFLQRFHTR